MKIVAWNIDGLREPVPEILERHGWPDVLMLQEVRIRANDRALVEALEKAADGYVCHHSLNRDPVNVKFRGGRAYGVVTFIREELGKNARMEVPAWDREGRFVLSHFDELGLTLGNLYAVNGTDKPYFRHDLDAFEGDRHEFKRRFQQHVLMHAADIVAKGRGVIIAGDFNVTPTKLDTHPRLRTEAPHALARAELAQHIEQCGMVDIWRHLHPEARGYSWFNRTAGNRLDASRVDYVLVSKDLVPKVKSAGILAEKEDRPGSDHAPITLEL